jgi:autotransporter-associated beta strand protein
MSGYSGTITNRNGTMTIQSTSTSTGGWIVNGGTLKLDTTDDTHIANGAGKANLVINGGTLDLNGKSETINGLSGVTGSVRNGLAATTSTVTLGDANVTAEFGGGIVDGNGIVRLIKIGLGVQTLSGSSTYTGDTLVSFGSLLVTGALGGTAVTVETGAALGGGGILAGALHFETGAMLIFDPADTLTVNGPEVTFANFGVANLAGLTSATPNGEYTLIDGSANVSTANLANLGIGQAATLAPGKVAYLESGSLRLIVIPEPATALLGGIGLLALLRRHRA